MDVTIDGYPASEPSLRDADEVVRAHDILAAVLLGELRVHLSEEMRASVSAALSALCYVLRHDHNQMFQQNLAAIEAAAASAGYEPRRKP